MGTLRFALLPMTALGLVVGCQHGARTPEKAFIEVERALVAGDAAALLPFLDRATRWSIDSAYRDQQLMRTLIEARYPEEEQPRALQPLAAASEPTVGRYFARLARERRTLEGLRKRLGAPSGALMRRPDGMSAIGLARADGMPLHFVRDDDGSWGLSELGADWALEKDRANHAVKTVRDNAALYKKAGP